MEKLFILDASGFVFRAYFALPEMKNPSGENTHAVFGFVRSVHKLIKSFSPTKMVAVFDGPDNKHSRQKIYSEYKSNRMVKLADLPEQMRTVKTFCSLLGLSYLEEPSVEADDVIASLTALVLDKGYEVSICTADKDLLQLIEPRVSVINPWKDNEVITTDDVEKKFGVSPKNIADYLALVGDSSDNIPGVFGCGPKKAAKLLGKYGSLESILENLDTLTPSDRNMMETYRQSAILSKQLALLDKNLQLSMPVNSLSFPAHDVNQENLNNFYKQQGFKTLVKSTIHEKPFDNVSVLSNPEEISKTLAQLTGKQIGFVTAYIGDHLPSLKCKGIAFAENSKKVFYIDLELSWKESQADIIRFFSNVDTKFYGYNMKRDIHALKNLGVKIQGQMYDLVLAEHLLNKGAKISYSTLLARLELADITHPFAKSWGDKKMPVTHLPENPEQYFGEFVSYLPSIKTKLFEELEKKGLMFIFSEIEMPLEEVLFHMERVGMPINASQLSALEIELENELRDITADIYRVAGKEFNIKSPKQLASVLYDHLGIKSIDKARSTKAEILEALVDEHEVVGKILSFRMIEKLLSTYVKALPKQIDIHTGRIHPTFNQTGTVTGRLSCQDPNLQNIPIRSEKGRLLRQAFSLSNTNHYFLSADYSQIELRFLAHLSEDASLIEAFASGEDIHLFTAAKVFHVPLNEVSELQRKQAKTVNFGIVYGQQAFGLSKVLKISVTEAQVLIDAYFAKYPQVAEFIAKTIEQASQELKVTTLLGRERLIDGWEGSLGSRAAAGRLAVNTRVQGSAAELIKIAMLAIFKEIKARRLRSRLLLQIHDELVFEVPEEEISEMQELIREKMESAMSISVPLVVNILIGKNWAEC